MKKRRFVSVLLALLLAAMAMVPMVSAAEGTAIDIQSDEKAANDPYRINGGYHIRLWELASGDVIGAAHQDSSVPHHAVSFETSESLIAGFFQNADDGTWRVYPNLQYLGNPFSNPYNNGYATMICD